MARLRFIWVLCAPLITSDDLVLLAASTGKMRIIRIVVVRSAEARVQRERMRLRSIGGAWFGSRGQGTTHQNGVSRSQRSLEFSAFDNSDGDGGVTRVFLSP